MSPPACGSCGAELRSGARFCNECGAAQQPDAVAAPAPPAAQPVAARRVTSVLFGDLVGFTSLSEHRDQEDTRELLTRYFDECRRVVERYGGIVEKFIGDAVMAVWGVPTAHEDDAERAVRAGLELVTAITAIGEDVDVPDLAMRVGIVTGEVAVTIGAEQQGMVAGDAVNTASRVQSVAAPGQVWVDETTRLLTASAITYVDTGSHQLKGKVDPIPLWSVRAVVASVGGGQRADGLEAPLVGRDRELRLVKELYHATEEGGRPALVVVDGEAGVGKSRLAWEFEKYTDGLSATQRWHSGRCLAYGEGVAFYALAEAVRGRLGAASADLEDEPELGQLLSHGLERYVPDDAEREWMAPRLGALLGIGQVGTFAREDLFAAWVTFFERAGGDSDVVVLVIEDGQHADEGLIAFVEHLLAVASFPCFVMMMTRPGLLEANPSLATNRRTTVLHLPTLSGADMARLLDGLVRGLPDDVRRRLVERAEGIPLFAVETVRSMIDRDLVIPRGGQYVLADADGLDLDALGAPASLQALITARLDTLSAGQRRVIDRASVLGESFRADEIEALCGDVPDVENVLGDLVRLQILSRESSRLSAAFGHYQFVQSVVRQIASSMLARRDRKAIHLAVVDLLEAEPSDDVGPMIAQHYLDAIAAVPGDDDVPELKRLASAQLQRAASRAAGLGSPGEAAGHLAAAHAIAADDAARARIASELAHVQTAAGRYDEAVLHAADALTAFDALGEEVDAGLAAARQAIALALGGGDVEVARALLEPRWERLKARHDADTTLLALTGAMTVVYRQLSMATRDIVEERLRIAERAGATDAVADGFAALANHYAFVGIPSLTLALLGAGAEIARAERWPVQLARALINLDALLINDDLDRAVVFGREALAVGVATGNSYSRSFARVNLALTLLALGEWAELEECLVDDDPEPSNLTCFLAVRACLNEARGQSWSLPWTPDTRVEWADPATMAWQIHCESLDARARGDLATATSLAMQVVEEIYRFGGRSDDFSHFWAAAAEVAVETGAREAWFRLLELAGDEHEHVPMALRAHRTRFDALWAVAEDPRQDAVEQRLRAAVELYEKWGSRVHAAKSRADLGLWLTGAGRLEEGAEMREQAAAVYEELGASAWLADLAARFETTAGAVL